MTSWGELLCLATVGLSIRCPLASMPLWVGLILLHRPLLMLASVVSLGLEHRAWWWTGLLVPWSLQGNVWMRLCQRATFYWQLLPIIVQHPWVGQGFNPWGIGRMVQQYGLALPSCHSDWLALTLHAGIVATGVALGLSWGLVRRASGVARSLLTTMLLLGVVQSVLERPGMVAIAIGVCFWILTHAKESAHA